MQYLNIESRGYSTELRKISLLQNISIVQENYDEANKPLFLRKDAPNFE